MSWDGNLMAPAVSSRSIDPLRFCHELCCRIARLFFGGGGVSFINFVV
jgi:hypothetical protein